MRIRSIFDVENYEYVTEVTFQLDAFKTLIKVTQHTIESDIRSKIESLEKIRKEEQETYLEAGFTFDEMEILTHTTNLYYSSIFISISSFLERKMLELCKVAEKSFETKVNQIRGSGIRQYYTYLT